MVKDSDIVVENIVPEAPEVRNPFQRILTSGQGSEGFRRQSCSQGSPPRECRSGPRGWQ